MKVRSLRLAQLEVATSPAWTRVPPVHSGWMGKGEMLTAFMFRGALPWVYLQALYKEFCAKLRLEVAVMLLDLI